MPRPNRLLLLLIAGGAAACTDPPTAAERVDDLAERSCAARFSCECTDYIYRDPADCELHTRTRLANWVAEAAAAGLTLDWECIEGREPPLTDGCKTYYEVELERPFPDYLHCAECRVAHGDGDVGTPCIDDGGMSTCKKGLACVPTDLGQRCIDACNPTEGALCESFTDCGEAMWCRRARCVPYQAIGEPCDTEDLRCGPDSRCDNVECQAILQAGEPCTSHWLCAEGTYCAMATGTCTPYPDVGEDCSTSLAQCAGDLVCDKPSRICRELPSPGEPCEGGYYCHPSALCDYESGLCVARHPNVCRE